MDLVEYSRFKLILESVRRLLHRGAVPNLKNILAKLHPADVAQLFSFMSPPEIYQLFDVIDDHEKAAKILSEADHESRSRILEKIDKERLTQILNTLPSDDATAILEDLPEELRAELITRLGLKQSVTVEEQLSYEEGSVGRIMLTRFVALPQDMTVSNAIEEVRHSKKHEIFYVYVVDQENRLKGVLSLRQLVIADADKKLEDIMMKDVIKVPPTVYQEEVARIVAHYDLLAVPVVDENEKLIGVVTVDDVVDIMHEEATDDILRLGGTREGDIATLSPLRSFKLRFPWLFVTFIGGIISSQVITAFSNTVSKFIYLAAFIPIIAGMGGNVGTQSVSVVIRGLATGKIDIRQLWQIISKEMRVGFLLGITYGLLLVGVAWLQFDNPTFGLAVGLAIFASMSIAATLGTFLPLFVHRLGFDPAFVSGPFISTILDLISITLYLVIATALLIT